METSVESNGTCYVETKNLDGEQNLKTKMAVPFPSEVKEIVCDKPNRNLYRFEGLIRNKYSEPVSLSADNLLLRGSSLRNTDYVIGIVIYAGNETKI